MGVPWKFLLPLLVLLPLGAFVIGSLVSAAHDEPPARTPIVLREDDTSPAPTSRPADPRPSGEDPTPETDDGHIVRPTPVEDDDDEDEDEGEDDGDDEDDD